MRYNARESDNNRSCSFYLSPCYYKGPGVYPCGYCTARHPNGSQRTARHNSNSYPDFNDRQRLANADFYSSDSFTVGNYHLVLGELANSFQSHLDAFREGYTYGNREIEIANRNLFFGNKQSNTNNKKTKISYSRQRVQ